MTSLWKALNRWPLLRRPSALSEFEEKSNACFCSFRPAPIRPDETFFPFVSVDRFAPSHSLSFLLQKTIVSESVYLTGEVNIRRSERALSVYLSGDRHVFVSS